MKKLTLITAIILTANLLLAQYNKIDTSFYSEALQEEKMVDVYFPPGYNENPDMYYPVIYYLHYWTGTQNTMGTEMMSTTQTLINNGTIDPVIMVCADNSPDPFNGSMYANSILWGDYEDYMANDLINWIESSFRAMPGKDYRGLLGHSMGGYGAWRFGTLHKDKFRVLAATAAPYLNLTDSCLSYTRTKIIQQNQPGPPYFYDYYSSGSTTMGVFLFSGAFTPNYNTPQTYINPAIVEFGLDENGNYIDTIMNKGKVNSISHLIHQLSPADSVGILVGCGTADISAIEPHRAFMDTLDMLGLPYEYYEHSGGHIMPPEFKQRALIFIDSLLMPSLIPPTNCLPEGITFTTQEEIDNFQINHPNCTEIEGDVEIMGNDITNLYGLNVLSAIGGNLKIWDTESLVTLSGLNDITYLGGDLFIGFDISGLPNNVSLASLTGLEGLTSIEGNLLIGGNEVLANLDGLNNLESISGDLIIFNNDTLSSLSGLNNLNIIGGDLQIGTWCFGFANDFPCGNKSLPDLTGLENLESIGGSLWIFGNDIMSDLTGIGNIDIINGDLKIYNNELLTTLSGLEDITIISGSLKIGTGDPFGYGNPSLIDLSSLNSLSTIEGDLQIRSNNSLSECAIESICNYLEYSSGQINIGFNALGCNSVDEVDSICNITSIQNFYKEYKISISPNPVEDHAILSLNIHTKSSLENCIYNTTGICLKSLQFQNQQPGEKEFILDLRELPAGVYFCRVQIGNEMVTKKIIKTK